MPANIKSYIGRQPAWHQLGTVTGRYLTWQDIIANGGLNYEVTKLRLTCWGEPIDAWGIFRTDILEEVQNKASCIYEINDAFLGMVGSEYTPIQHNTGFQMIDALVASTDGAHYETAGALGKGEVVWGLAALNIAIHVGDDEHQEYLLFSTSHDGSHAHDYRLTGVRVVCQNTLSLALSAKAKASFRVKHTKNAMQRIDAAHDALQRIKGDVMAMEAKLNFLASRRVTKESFQVISERLFPSKLDEQGKPVETTRRANILADILRLWEENDDNQFPEQAGTAYALLNAVTNYVDHERSTHGGKRAESAMFGSGDKLKQTAMMVLEAEAQTMPTRASQRSVMVLETPTAHLPLGEAFDIAEAEYHAGSSATELQSMMDAQIADLDFDPTE